MKHFFVQFSVFLVVILLTSCKKEKKSIVDFDHFPKEFQVKAEHIAPENGVVLGASNSIVVMDSIIIVNDSDQNGLIKFFSKKTGKYLGSAGKKGEGPNELIWAWKIINVNDSSILVIDIVKNSIFRFNVKHALQNKNYSPQLVVDFNKRGHTYAFSAVYIHDSIFVTPDTKVDNRLTFSNDKGEVYFKKGHYNDYSKNANFDNSKLLSLNKDFLASSPNGKVIVSALFYFDILELFDETGNFIKAVRGPVNLKNEFRFKNNVIIPKNNDRYGYAALYCTNKNIYAVFSGESYGKNDNLEGKNIHVFSLDGTPKCMYKIDVPICSIYVDEVNQVIYGIDLTNEKQIVTINLKNAKQI